MGSMAKGLALIPELAYSSPAASSAAAAATAAVIGQGISQGWSRWAGQVHAREWMEKPYFAQQRPSGTRLMTAPDPPNGIMYVKMYPSAPRSLVTVLQPRLLTLAMFKSLFLQSLIVVVRSLHELQRADDEAWHAGREPDFRPVTLVPAEDVKPILKRSCIGFLRDVAVQTIRQIFDIIAGQKLNPRTAWKLRKGFKTSALRKRFLPWYVRPYRVTKTVFTSSLLSCLADWTVTSYIDTYRLSKQGWRKSGIARFTTRLVLRMTANALKISVCMVGASIGAGVMSAVWPGAGTVIGYNAADLAMNFVIVNPLVDSYFGGLPPPAAMDAAVLTGDAPLPRPTFQRADERALQGVIEDSDSEEDVTKVGNGNGYQEALR